ncbi:NADH-quinone oxidoreductase subunit F [Thermococcus sp. Bubb.Bath]|uniref:NADH-quinone oxidoreductase subunit D-related protein n=1 Tax=Thermococcus sp. Bubb.Bath TaxID=1638242 RepID=UPI00143AB41E|nr:NADH-quinone oxidoreductase subunit F [Thermococcus sp. Bubb.Bath]NJF24520.1 NADH-quinone oxidoreductase subunit F [Thermococcus sp. Bubb.Bath]
MKVLSAVFRKNGKFLSVWLDYETGRAELEYTDKLPDRKIAPALISDTSPYITIPPGSNAVPLTFGPAAGGLGQAGAFEILTYGERIVSIRPVYGYKRRGIEERLLNRPIEESVVVLERATGNFSLAYTYALLKAIEENPDEEVWEVRKALLEIERLYNHFNAIHKLAGAASQKVATMHFHALEEDVLRLLSRLTGHRYGFSANRPGEVRILEPKAVERLGKIREEFRSLREELLESKIFIDRLHNTCRLSREDIIELDAVGIAARGSGIARDVRSFDRYYSYKPVTCEEGDALARMMVRLEEIERSFEIIDSVDVKAVRSDPSVKEGLNLGVAEAAHGDVLTLVEVKDGRISWIGLRGASRVNYIAFSRGITGNIFTDFPFGLESFGLNFADADLWQGGVE